MWQTKYLNYRPISILTSFSKEVEKATDIQLCEHTSKNSILADETIWF